MDVDFFVNKLLIDNDILTFWERDEIIEDIIKRQTDLPKKIENPYTIETFEMLDDKTLVLFLSDLHEILAMKHFNINKKIL